MLEYFLSQAEDVKPLGLEVGLMGKRIIVTGLGKVELHAAHAQAPAHLDQGPELCGPSTGIEE